MLNSKKNLWFFLFRIKLGKLSKSRCDAAFGVSQGARTLRACLRSASTTGAQSRRDNKSVFAHSRLTIIIRTVCFTEQKHNQAHQAKYKLTGMVNRGRIISLAFQRWNGRETLRLIVRSHKTVQFCMGNSIARDRCKVNGSFNGLYFCYDSMAAPPGESALLNTQVLYTPFKIICICVVFEQKKQTRSRVRETGIDVKHFLCQGWSAILVRSPRYENYFRLERSRLVLIHLRPRRWILRGVYRKVLTHSAARLGVWYPWLPAA